MTRNDSASYTIEWIRKIADIDQSQWDALAVPLDTPLLEWDWLSLMERSGSISPKNGWLPNHLVVRRGRKLAAAAPLYIKGHSAGEFVFDHAWADVAGQLEIPYYPKLVGMSPVTPAVGYRFLVAPGEDERGITQLMMRQIDKFCRRHGVSGCSFLFVDPAWRPLAESFGYLGWKHQSYLWRNPGFNGFDDYLARFNSNQRRNIKRERRALRDKGVRLVPFVADEIPKDFFSLIYRFYERTNDRYGPWGCKYLSESFFKGLYDRYRHRLLFIAAYDTQSNGVPIGMSMLLWKGARLYGRYWGSFDEVPYLHFNTCFYDPINWAIANGVQEFDPGAGSPHKLRRGFEATPNFSLHRFFDLRLDRIFKTYIDDINRMEQEQIDDLNRQLPFARRE
ncbi:FIG110192: hypothetical protein [Olavius algarvensis associated proteobacterium Delta 3]|nr:FIG110192: hypothetical protein [Olavius algarvensis associated proteobacterium Delta 3]